MELPALYAVCVSTLKSFWWRMPLASVFSRPEWVAVSCLSIKVLQLQVVAQLDALSVLGASCSSKVHELINIYC